ncbi:MAG TPA: hypothetical protein VHT53_11525 [Candidatus Elarobacter sp.]|jgi:hypothetical protein|nr:hypothetical protein [Candidatus Elarobacter sp.]
MDDFDDAVLGRLASGVGKTMRELKRSLRNMRTAPRTTSYSPEQTAAAQGVVAALLDVDTAFADCRLTEPFPYCECCTDRDLIDRLMSVPRDRLSEDDIALVAHSILSTLGGAQDFRYFVPRFCADSMESPLYDIDDIFARFRNAGFGTWPANEQRAVRSFLAAYWRCMLLTLPPADAMSELMDPCFRILDCIASLGDIDRALGTWESTQADTADARLLDLLGRLDFEGGRLSIVGVGANSDNADAYARLATWLRSTPVRLRIGGALSSVRTGDPARAGRIDEALSALSALG